MEIKCPFSIDGKDITNLSPVEIALQHPGQFCLVAREGAVALSRSHKYYQPVQGEMAVCRHSWCDFVVWTKAGIFIERISFDELFWQHMLSSLQEFFRGALLPELVLRRVQRGLQLDGSDIDMPSLLEAMEVDDLEDS